MKLLSINPKIIKKINEKCSDSPELKEFLYHVLDLEAEQTGWWTDKYRELITKYSGGGERRED